MKRLLLILLAVGVSAGLSQRGAIAAAPNTLTPEEQKEGFVLLFDGKTLDKFDATPQLAKSLHVVDGAIKTNAKVGGGTMLTKEDYANFVLKAEFRAHPDINSGIMLRNRRRRSPNGTRKKGGGGARGYELQIRDKDPGNYTGGSFLTASIVNVGKAPADAKIKPGEWNTFEVTVNGDHFVVIYNGKKVVDAHDAKMMLKAGAIGLQLAHPEDAPAADIEFCNLKIKRLP